MNAVQVNVFHWSHFLSPNNVDVRNQYGDNVKKILSIYLLNLLDKK